MKSLVRSVLRVASYLALLTAPLNSVATAGELPEDPVASKIRSVLHERFPDVKVDTIAPAPVSGLYEVVTGAEIVYTDASADHLISGRIVDTHSRMDLTAQRWDVLHSIDFSSLPLDLAIKEVRGDGVRKLAIFEDPHCPFCAQLERDTRDLNNVTIYRYLFPLENLHPGAEATAAGIWCSKDREAAWTNWMRERSEPPAKPCDDFPRTRLAALGEQYGVTGTPTLFVASGRRLFGASTTAKIEALIGGR